MRRRSLLVAAALGLTARASAADTVVKLTLDGRPVDRNGGIAVMRHGVVFADAIDLTKCFDGFITLQRSGAATITIGPNTATFTPGSARATIDAQEVVLPDPPFMRNGALFVPLERFITGVAGANVEFSHARHRADIRVGVRLVRR